MEDKNIPKTAPAITIPGEQAGELITGMLDVLVAFGVVLANRGLIERADIADAMGRCLEQLTRHPVNTPARRYPIETMRAIFSIPVTAGGRGRAGLVPIDGGKASAPDDDPPADPAA